MTAPALPRVCGDPPGSAVIRCTPEDFIVREQLGFAPSGEGEHAFLHLEKRELNTTDLQDRLSRLSGVASRDIGFSGMKDRNAVTRQWFSVGLAGKSEPDWQQLEQDGNITVLQVDRHIRKLRRGVHRANQFELRLRKIVGDPGEIEERLQRVASQGVPNYFGGQRFGRGGNTLVQARQWAVSGGRKLTRKKRGLFLSALRSHLFNRLLADRVVRQSWNRVDDGDVCMLRGSRSRFSCECVDDDIRARSDVGDLSPGLPLWGRGEPEVASQVFEAQMAVLAEEGNYCEFLEQEGLTLDYRTSRLMPDDFCWQFCDDDSLQLTFELAPGGYATAVLAELVQFSEGEVGSGNGSE